MKKFFKKTFKRLKKGVKSIGKGLKKGLGKIGKAFGKLGPLGTLALSLMLPGLGTAFTSFGTWANTLSGPLGAVMKGVASAGNAIGTVYSSVTDMVGGVVRNTVGKIPVGGGQNLAGTYDKFSGWVSNKLDTTRRSFGMETSMTDTTLDSTLKSNASSLKDVSSVAEKQVQSSLNAGLKPADTSSLLAPSKDGLKLAQPDNLLKDTSFNMETGKMDFSKMPKAGDVNIDALKNVDTSNLARTELGTFDIDKMRTSGEVVQVPIGYEKTVPTDISRNIKDLGFTPENAPSTYKMQYKDVYKNDLSADQLKTLDLDNSQYYVDYQNNRTNKFLGSANEKTGELSTRSLLTQDARATVSPTLTAGVSALTPQEEIVPSKPGYIPASLDTNVTSMNDYTKTYGSQPAYMDMGASDISSMYAQGNYGGDIFTFGNILRQRNPVGGIPSTLSTRNLT
tara:strand:+ start:2719 stop:4071 length:1353 start_codon:yes stop_codon:yes gene_type:complete